MGGFRNTSAVESATCETGKAQTITDTTGNEFAKISLQLQGGFCAFEPFATKNEAVIMKAKAKARRRLSQNVGGARGETPHERRKIKKSFFEKAHKNT